MCNLLGAEMEKRRRLAEVIQQVQEDKRKLETAIIMDVNQQAARSTSNNTNVDTDDGEDYEEDASFSSEEVPSARGCLFSFSC